MRYILLPALAFLTISFTADFTIAESSSYGARIAPLLPAQGKDKDKLGVVVKSLSTGETLYEHNGERLFIPASNEKIITSVAALGILQSDYRFKTEFYSGGGISNGVLHGGLYIKGFGDPTLEAAHLGFITYQLKRRGINEIKGGITVDDSFFGPRRHAKGWKEEWKDDFYSPHISALSFNYNIIELKVYAAKSGQRPSAKIEPGGSGIEIINKALTSGKKGALRTTWQDQNTLVLSGVIKPRATVVLKIPVKNPALMTGNVIKNALEEAGIAVEGTVSQGQIPRWASAFYIHYSDPLSSIISEYNKNSVNIIGENLIKVLGATYKGVPGTWESGSEVVSEYLRNAGIDNGFTVADGSGLSLNNRVSPETLTDILTYAYKNRLIAEDFIVSLPVAGVDGTLKKRFRGSELEGRVMAKTGYLKNVRALSGYVFTKKGDVLVFSILSNGYGWKTKEYQSLLLSELVNCCEYYTPGGGER